MARPENCMSCERPVRSSHTKKADAPDTVVYSARGLCATCVKTAGAGEDMELCRWVPAGEVFRAELVTGVLVSQSVHVYRLMIDRKVHTYDRPEWHEVIA